MRHGIFACLVFLAACGDEEPADDCTADTEVDVFADDDGDGFGGASAGTACAPGAGQVLNDDDCDDTNGDVRPNKTELCNGFDDDCDGEVDQGFNLHIFYEDLDLDTYGNDAVPLVACKAPTDTWTQTPGDCDDTAVGVNPGAAEVCNGGVDDDCDTLADLLDDSLDPASMTGFYPDDDLDGFGAVSPVQPACEAAPSSGLVDNNLDCNDRDNLINPNATEICNADLDDDCDGLRDDLDDSLDVSGQLPFYEDLDGDGAGNPDVTVQLCSPRVGAGVENTFDCDDTQPSVNQGANEVLCDLLDNDCDPLTSDDRDLDGDLSFVCVDDCDDTDPTIYPGAPETPADFIDSDCDLLEDCYQDADGDFARTDVAIPVAGDARCTTPPNAPPMFPVDCDDSDAGISWSGAWWRDADLDGFGSGVVVLQSCADPGPGYLLEGGEIDCDDGLPGVNPGATDDCNDGVDADCDTSDSCESCSAWLITDGSLPSGTYEIRADGETPTDVYCDMDTDGGGWTLVASSLGLPLADRSGTYHTDLTTLVPTGIHTGIWDGLRDLLPGDADVRFACKLAAADPDFEVDLSFYGVPWYAEFTTGSDAQSCFSEGGNPDPAFDRRDNLTGQNLSSANPYEGAGLEGEDACNDADDFTIDFDDQGMDGDQADGTDWGSDDGKKKCGVSEAGDAWYLFAR